MTFVLSHPIKTLLSCPPSPLPPSWWICCCKVIGQRSSRITDQQPASTVESARRWSRSCWRSKWADHGVMHFSWIEKWRDTWRHRLRGAILRTMIALPNNIQVTFGEVNPLRRMPCFVTFGHSCVTQLDDFVTFGQCFVTQFIEFRDVWPIFCGRYASYVTFGSSCATQFDEFVTFGQPCVQ